MKPISIRMDKDLLKVIDRIARLQGTTRSRFIRRIIEDYIENGTLYKLAVRRLRDKNDPVLTREEFEKELRRSR
jgi:predicted DNA-binding protein